jgi:D-alanyl-D-alanine carboxypeptidase/D-alanyl-D-alanine-endopeptidase (penicillin-binding protein 4)
VPGARRRNLPLGAGFEIFETMPRAICILAAALLAALAPAASAAGPAATRRVLSKQMALAGSGSSAYVVDLDTEEPIYDDAGSVGRMPASVEKLYTSATALLRLGPQGALTTSVLADAAPDSFGVMAGNLYLHGGGDPSFDAAAAGRLASALILQTHLTEIDGRVIGDESFFDGLRGPPSEGFVTTFEVGPLSALTFNHGFTGKRSPVFQASPPQFAAQAFTRALRKRGVLVNGSARAGVAPPEAVPLTAWNSPAISDIVAAMNVPSDNFIAETLIKALGARFGQAGSTAGGAAVVRSSMAGLGIRTTVVDGSGLSRSDRTSPRAVVSLLEAMDQSELAAPFYASLPTAGRTGTLAHRMRHTAARDACHAKTGTLSNVSALAGYCTTRSGNRVAFAFLMNRVYPAGAQRLQDRMAVALAHYVP